MTLALYQNLVFSETVRDGNTFLISMHFSVLAAWCPCTQIFLLILLVIMQWHFKKRHGREHTSIKIFLSFLFDFFLKVSHICEYQNKVFYRVVKLLSLLQVDQAIGQVLPQNY